MRHLVFKIAAFAALAAFAGPTLAQAPPPPPPPAHHGILGHLFHHPARPGTTGQGPLSGGTMRPGQAGATTPITGGVVGNKNSHVYHLPGDKGALPAAKNRVYFRSAAEAEAAGYHRAGSSSHHGPSAAHSGHASPTNGSR